MISQFTRGGYRYTTFANAGDARAYCAAHLGATMQPIGGGVYEVSEKQALSLEPLSDSSYHNGRTLLDARGPHTW